ncbi:restriction endonuclease subunit S [Undibacterium sp.]|uniref:restriction endonuclease subunit S n=1 Tax=Undibacterium sp. TaxID=1914977 RepID=UPI003751110C
MDKKLIPTGYKQTDLGLIPHDWAVKTLNELAERISVGIASAATHAYSDRGVPFLRNQNIKPNRLDDSDILFIKNEYESLFSNKRLRAGDLITARTGYPGTTCIVPQKYENAQSFTTLVTRLKTGESNPEFICFYMNSEGGQKFFELNQIGGGQKNVNASILRTLTIPFPKNEEQTAIANALSDVDALIAALEKLINKKSAIKTAAMQQLLTGKKRLPPFDQLNTGYKQTEFGKIPSDWELSTIGQNTHWMSGGTPSRKNDAYWSGKIPWISGSTLKSAEISTSDQFLTAEAIDVGSQMAPLNSTLLLVRGSALHNEIRAGLVVAPVSFNQDVKALIPIGSVAPKYLTLYLLGMNSNLLKLVSSAGNSAGVLDTELVQNFYFFKPSKLEQIAIENALSEMDKDLDAIQQRLNKTQQIKQGMMQELLTGKTRLVKPQGDAIA